MAQSGPSFLHERNQNFHASQEVELVADYLRSHGKELPNEPVKKIEEYLGFMAHEGYVNDGILTGDKESIDRQVEASCVALTQENADAYVKFQAKVARELGRGAEVDPDAMDEQAKMAALRSVRKDQQSQLTEWAYELNSDENNYADWFKHWMFESVKRHTAFNDEPSKNGQPKGFERRSGSSFALYPELDRQSTSLVYDALTEKLGGDPMGFEYGGMRALLAKANFGELYGEAQNYGFKITESLKEVTTGSWRDFAQGDHAADAQALASLVSSYRTGWCTAGSETASVQLSAGDFYVWCSTNPETGKDEVPRIAVRMERGVVAEVRGIVGGRRQELEPVLADTVMEKIQAMPGGESYFQKAEDMKRLTVIEKKVAKSHDAELASDELRFLYELDHAIQGFGYGADPRIQEIRALRGDTDKPELARILPESIRAQVRSAYEAYQQVASKLTSGAKRGLFGRRETVASTVDFEQAFAIKDHQWQQNGRYDYLVEQLITTGTRFNLVATPNIEASEEQVVGLAVDFGKDQPYETYVYESLYRRAVHTARAWSGNKGDAQLSFSLIPNKTDEELSGRSVNEQVALLRERQLRRPDLAAHVPSVLQAITYWYALRAQGDKLVGDAAFDKTYIRHFDMEPKSVGGWPVVPRSFVNFDGEPVLFYSGAENLGRARVAVG